MTDEQRLHTEQPGDEDALKRLGRAASRQRMGFGLFWGVEGLFLTNRAALQCQLVPLND